MLQPSEFLLHVWIVVFVHINKFSLERLRPTSAANVPTFELPQAASAQHGSQQTYPHFTYNQQLHQKTNCNKRAHISIISSSYNTKRTAANVPTFQLPTPCQLTPKSYTTFQLPSSKFMHSWKITRNHSTKRTASHVSTFKLPPPFQLHQTARTVFVFVEQN